MFSVKEEAEDLPEKESVKESYPGLEKSRKAFGTISAYVAIYSKSESEKRMIIFNL